MHFSDAQNAFSSPQMHHEQLHLTDVNCFASVKVIGLTWNKKKKNIPAPLTKRLSEFFSLVNGYTTCNKVGVFDMSSHNVPIYSLLCAL